MPPPRPRQCIEIERVFYHLSRDRRASASTRTKLPKQTTVVRTTPTTEGHACVLGLRDVDISVVDVRWDVQLHNLGEGADHQIQDSEAI